MWHGGQGSAGNCMNMYELTRDSTQKDPPSLLHHTACNGMDIFQSSYFLFCPNKFISYWNINCQLVGKECSKWDDVHHSRTHN